jgi:hypothetical protein
MGDMSLPVDYPTVPRSVYDDAKLVRLAREIAMGIRDLPDILTAHSLSQTEYDILIEAPHFRNLLASEVSAWDGALNTQERIKVKSGSLIEEYLPELYSRLQDRNEPLMAKIKAMELIGKFAGFGDRDIPAAGNPGDRVQVIINLGADVKLQYDKELPRQVIDVTPTPTESSDVCTNQV